MPRKKTTPPRPAEPNEGGRKRLQVNVGFDPDLGDRLAACARLLGLDNTNFVRLVLAENLAAYERRARAAKAGPQPGDN